MQARTAVDRSSVLRIGASSKAPIRVRLHLLAARAEASRHGASLRLRGVPCLGPASPDASGARCNRVVIVWVSCSRTPKTKRPRVLEPEGVRVASGDRGDRSPRCERISRCGWSLGNSACRFRAKAHHAVRTRAGPHRAWAMAAVQRCGRNASWNSLFGGSPRGEVAHLTRAFFVWQQIFYITDKRRDSCRWAARKTWRIHFDAMRASVRDRHAFRPQEDPHRCGLFRFHPTAKKKPAERRVLLEAGSLPAQG